MVCSRAHGFDSLDQICTWIVIAMVAMVVILGQPSLRTPCTSLPRPAPVNQNVILARVHIASLLLFIIPKAS